MPSSNKGTFYAALRAASKSGDRLLAVLIDPEKIEQSSLPQVIDQLNKSMVTHIFVGGSTDRLNQTATLVPAIKKLSKLPVILFPGHYDQLTSNADALLFLSLISGRNPEYLIGQQVRAARVLKNVELEVVPTGYILIDGGTPTAVARVSETQPIAQNEIDHIAHTALAGQYLGQQLIYLEAGSGAAEPVHPEVISAVKKTIKIPIIVGGGIRSKAQLESAYQAGADLVVIGTAFEHNDLFFKELKQ